MPGFFYACCDNHRYHSGADTQLTRHTMTYVPRGHIRKIASTLALVVAVALALCGAQPTTQPVAGATRPLIGKIWDVRRQRFVPETELLARLGTTDFVLLGEIHDNPDHHARQAAVLSSLVRAGRRPALVMEQFDRENQAALDTALAAGADTEAIAVAGRFDREGWQWERYEPLVRIAVDAKLPIVAANLSRRAARDVAARGFDQLQPPPAALALVDVWSNARETTMAQTLVDSHCGQLRPEDVAPLTRAQRARDAVIADSLLRYRANGALLIAGAGHVRRDLAVPLYLRARAPDASITAVALTEVEPGVDDVAAYQTAAAAGSIDPAFDYLWFSARAEREDPCAGFSMPKRPGNKATPRKDGTPAQPSNHAQPSTPRP
jgi:uncharacterized iron-regulated protein